MNPHTSLALPVAMLSSVLSTALAVKFSQPGTGVLPACRAASCAETTPALSHHGLLPSQSFHSTSSAVMTTGYGNVGAVCGIDSENKRQLSLTDTERHRHQACIHAEACSQFSRHRRRGVTSGCVLRSKLDLLLHFSQSASNTATMAPNVNSSWPNDANEGDVSPDIICIYRSSSSSRSSTEFSGGGCQLICSMRRSISATWSISSTTTNSGTSTASQGFGLSSLCSGTSPCTYQEPTTRHSDCGKNSPPIIRGHNMHGIMSALNSFGVSDVRSQAVTSIWRTWNSTCWDIVDEDISLTTCNCNILCHSSSSSSGGGGGGGVVS